jgi:uncharacterized protein (DUF1330 family)
MGMSKGYWVATVDVHDAERYKAYIAANAEPFRNFGARVLVRAGRYECPEGSCRTRNVVIEFPSYEAALECYRSPGYAKAIALRVPVSTIDLVIVEGYEGPQP